MRIARLAILLLALACTTTRAPERFATVTAHEAGNVDASLFLVGDAGVGANSMLDALREAVATRASEVGKDRVAIAFLGDNVYPAGVPVNAPSSPQLTAQIAAAGAAGKIVFVPGNHDWDYRGREGLPRIRRQGTLIEQGGAQMLPRNGCPGPEPIEVGSRLRIVAIDTQWWLHTKDARCVSDCRKRCSRLRGRRSHTRRDTSTRSKCCAETARVICS